MIIEKLGGGFTDQMMGAMVMFGKTEKMEKEKIIRDLLEYCKQDTQAMVDIVNWLTDA